MKLTKKCFAFFLATLLLMTLLIPATATDQRVTKLSARVSKPLIGQTAGSLTVTSTEPEKYAAQITDIYYWKIVSAGKKEACYLNADDVFRSGIYYMCRVKFSPADGWEIDYANATCEIVGYSGVTQIGTSVWEFGFNAQEEQIGAPEPVTGCVYCGGKHTGILGFFVQIIHNVLYRLFGAKKK